MASAQMRRLWSVGKYPYRFAVFYAAPAARFTKPGVYVWAFGRQTRVFPLRKVAS
jgi:hypothetical protein